MTSQLDAELRSHFHHPDRQEDLTFALWVPSVGAVRFTAVMTDLMPPDDTERHLHGNVAFTADYLARVLASAPAGSGIALHSHLGPGWQDIEPRRRDRRTRSASFRRRWRDWSAVARPDLGNRRNLERPVPGS